MQAIEALKQVKDSAESIRNDKPQRFPDAASAGDFVRQGDIYVTLLPELPANVVSDKGDLQLAPGNTKGSRHILDSGEGVSFYRVSGADELTGPVIETTEERTITHPEHGDWTLPPGCYSITYQRAFADEMRRVRD